MTDGQSVVLASRNKNVILSQWIVDSNIQVIYWNSIIK